MAKAAAIAQGKSKPDLLAALAGRLGLAASPTFALMAGMSVLGPSGMVICGPASPLAPLGDMAVMYALMSLFHLPPWLNLLARRSRRPSPQPKETNDATCCRFT